VSGPSTTGESVDEFLDALEKMIDAQDDMWHEEQHCNYRERERIRDEVYKPARARASECLRQAIREIIEEEGYATRSP